MSLVQAKPWPKIVAFYIRIGSQWEPIRNFAEQISESQFSKGLFACTSMQTLVVGQTEELDPQREVLYVKYDPNKKMFNFEFRETASRTRKRWMRTSSEADAFKTFVRFLELKKWFLRSPASPQ